jgi:hypothetical protein
MIELLQRLDLQIKWQKEEKLLKGELLLLDMLVLGAPLLLQEQELTADVRLVYHHLPFEVVLPQLLEGSEAHLHLDFTPLTRRLTSNTANLDSDALVRLVWGSMEVYVTKVGVVQRVGLDVNIHTETRKGNTSTDRRSLHQRVHLVGHGQPMSE